MMTARNRGKTREEMMDDVIKKYGFESEITILFCKACEECESNYKIICTYRMLMAEYS